MSLFSMKNASDRFGVVIDIGSGSVLTSIVHANSKNEYPTIVWTHREHAPLRNSDSINKSAKSVMSALVNACMKLDAEGRKALAEYKPGAKLSVMQTCISAPWSYTVSKTIDYKQSEAIEITDDLVDELIFSAQKKVEEELKENEVVHNLGLRLITRTTMDLLANGYRVKDPDGEKASSVKLAQATVVAQQYLIDAIDEMHDKLFQGTKQRKLSFILMFYCSIRDFLPEQDDVCLVDVTFEATEIGIVRDGSLTYSTHTPFGLFSLAREIAAITNLPLYEISGYLHSPTPLEFMESLPETQKTEIQTVLDAYTTKVSDLFKETGDSLSIPKRVLLHADAAAEPLLKNIISMAAKKATKIDHGIVSIANDVLTIEYKKQLGANIGDYKNDTALLLSAQFFHKQKHCLDFNYL